MAAADTASFADTSKVMSFPGSVTRTTGGSSGSATICATTGWFGTSEASLTMIRYRPLRATSISPRAVWPPATVIGVSVHCPRRPGSSLSPERSIVPTERLADLSGRSAEASMRTRVPIGALMFPIGLGGSALSGRFMYAGKTYVSLTSRTPGRVRTTTAYRSLTKSPALTR